MSLSPFAKKIPLFSHQASYCHRTISHFPHLFLSSLSPKYILEHLFLLERLVHYSSTSFSCAHLGKCHRLVHCWVCSLLDEANQSETNFNALLLWLLITLVFTEKKKKEKNQLINQNLCKKFLVDKLSRVYLLKALLKPIKVTHSKKTDFFPVCCIHLRLVVKYKRFISEFPLKYLCGSSLLVGILQDLISAKSRLSY